MSPTLPKCLLALVLIPQLLSPLRAQIENFHTSAGTVRAIAVEDTTMCLTGTAGIAFLDLWRVGSPYGTSTLPGGLQPRTLLAASGGRFYFGNQSSNIVGHRSSTSTSFGTATVTGWVLSTDSPITLSGGTTFYGLGDAFDEFMEPRRVYRKRSIATPSLFFDNADVIADLEGLNAGYSGFADLMVLGAYGQDLKRAREIPTIGPPPDFTPGTAVVSATIANRVGAMAVRSGRVYFAERDVSDNTIIRLKSAVSTGLGTPMTITTYSPAWDAAAPTAFTDLTVTPDGRYAFVKEQIGGVRNLLRKDLTNNSAFQLIATASPATDDFRQLQSTNNHAYFIRNSTVVGRIATNAPVATRDIAAGGLEVVQAIQNPTNDCPLVEGKTTHARFFARIAASSSGESSLTLPVLLHGSSGGVPLPGSPLTPRSGPAAVTNAVIDRTQDSSNCWTFLLPDSWTRGEVALAATINGTRATSETGFGNNVSPANVSFRNTGAMEVRFLPTLTVHGTIRRTLPEYQRALDHLEAMFPATRMNFTWRGGEMSRPLIPFYCDGNGHFEVRAAFDDGWLMLVTQLFYNAMDLAGPRVHYVSLLPEFEGMVGWSGLAMPGLYDIGLITPASAWFVNLGENDLGHPRMSGTAAQELAHNFGLAHVNCGSPDSPNLAYPYDPATLSSAAAGYVGMDPLRHTLIQPDFAKDFMSYCSPKWTSDYTWRALLNRLPNLPAGVPIISNSPTGNSLVGGYVDRHGDAVFLPVCPLAEAGSKAAAARLITGPSHPKWQLHFLKDGVLVDNADIKYFATPADDGASHGTTLLAQLDLPAADFDAMALVNTADDTVMGLLEAGINPPAVTLLSPVGGENFTPGSHPLIKWSASDPDGDVVQTTVRWSNDSGATWRTLALAAEGNSLATDGMLLPGDNKPTCLVQLIATDGLHSTTVQSAAFGYPNQPPTVVIQPTTPRGTGATEAAVVSALAGETITLRGISADLEDASPPAVSWDILAPDGTHILGTGEQLPIAGLEPGNYTASAKVFDTLGAAGNASLLIKVHRRFINNAATNLVLDGVAMEPAWGADLQPTPLPFAGSIVPVRFVHRDGAMWVSASGIADGSAVDTSFLLALDLDNSGGGTPSTGDLLIQASARGDLRTFAGSATGWSEDAFPDSVERHIFVSGGWWTVELRIPDTKLGGWNGREVGGAVFCDHGTSSYSDSSWPAHAVRTNPATWTRFVFGVDEDDLTDADGNGLPDQWEFDTYGSAGWDPQKNADTDGDGQSDKDEFTAGTDPLQGSSRFVSLVDSGSQLSWATSPCRTYSIWTSTDLTAWDLVASGLTSGSWPYSIDPSRPKLFFRVTAAYER